MSGLAVGFMACENMARGEIKRQKWGLIMFNICLIPSKKSLRCDKNGQYVLFFSETCLWMGHQTNHTGSGDRMLPTWGWYESSWLPLPISFHRSR
jgi:hypothetical protein